MGLLGSSFGTTAKLTEGVDHPPRGGLEGTQILIVLEWFAGLYEQLHPGWLKQFDLNSLPVLKGMN